MFTAYKGQAALFSVIGKNSSTSLAHCRYTVGNCTSRRKMNRIAEVSHLGS